jgi:hypothetical protein
MLEIVHEGEKDRRHERRRDSDHGAQDDQTKVRPRAQFRVCVLTHPISSDDP